MYSLITIHRHSQQIKSYCNDSSLWKKHSITGKIYHVLKYFLFLYNSKQELTGMIVVFKGPEETGSFQKRSKVLAYISQKISISSIRR